MIRDRTLKGDRGLRCLDARDEHPERLTVSAKAERNGDPEPCLARTARGAEEVRCRTLDRWVTSWELVGRQIHRCMAFGLFESTAGHHRRTDRWTARRSDRHNGKDSGNDWQCVPSR